MSTGGTVLGPKNGLLRFCRPTGMAAVLVVFASGFTLESGPAKEEISRWLGSFRSGPERVRVVWNEGLWLHLDKIVVPVDGRWHETVPEFSVRHRATWVADQALIRLEEQHNYTALDPAQDSGWHYELRLDDRTGDLQKIVPEGDGQKRVVMRIYRRQQRKDSSL